MSIISDLKTLWKGKAIKGFVLLSLLIIVPAFRPIFGNITSIIVYVIYGYIFLISRKVYVQKINSHIFKWLKYFLAYAIITGLICPYIFWEQPLIMSLHAMLNFIGVWLLFGYFVQNKFNINEIENSVILSSIAYTIGYFYMFFFHHSIWLYQEVGNVDDTNMYRMFFGNCQILLYSFLISINRYFYTKRTIYLLFIAMCFAVILMLQTRQIFLVLTIITLFYSIKRFSRKTIIGCLLFIAVVLPLSKPFFEGILEKTKNQNQMGTSTTAIRVLEYEFYFCDANTTIFQDLFGNGIGQENSKLDQFWRKYAAGPVADAGYAGIFNYWGAIGLLMFLVLFVQAKKIKLPEQRKWVWMCICMAYMLNIMSFDLRSGFIVIPLYILHIISQPHKINHQKMK